MNAKLAASIIACAVVGGVSLGYFNCARQFPRVKLSDGGEFRVVKIAYGTEYDHILGRAPKPIFWIWDHLPAPLQRVLPHPNEGVVDSEIPPPNQIALSIWWAWFDPVNHKPLLGSSGDVIMTLDSGEQKNLGWPDAGGEFRRILIMDPPNNSKRVRFSVPVNDLEKPVVFEIENPAYRGSR